MDKKTDNTKSCDAKMDKYSSDDLKFVNKYRKHIINHVENYACQYLALIRPSNDKKVIMDTQGKDQIMYILCKLINIVSVIGSVSDDCNNVTVLIENSLDTSSIDYKIYKFLTGVTRHIKYNLMGEKIEEELLHTISQYIKDEDLMQHTVEVFLLFMKRFSQSLANHNWESTKSTNHKLVNALLRNMDTANTNPDIFMDIFNFSCYAKKMSAKK